MYARVMTIQLPSDRLEEFVRHVRERSVPTMQGLAGFTNVHVLVNRERGTAAFVSMFESEEALRRSESQAAQDRTHLLEQMGASDPTVAQYEVAVAEGSGDQARAARVTTLRNAPERIDQTVQQYRELVVPRLQEHPPIRGLRLLVNRATGACLAVALWESMEAMHATEEVARGQRDRAQQASGTEFTSVDRYEIVA